MMSGYFFSGKNLDNPKDFVWRRITVLWMPFVKWGGFVLLHNVFLKLQLLPLPPLFLCINNVYNVKGVLWKGLTVIPRFIPTENMMGTYWLSFLFVLHKYFELEYF